MATVTKSKNANARKPYIVRYFHEGRQLQKAFATKTEANNFKAKFEYESRAQTFVDPKVAGEKFGAVAQRWLARHPGSPQTKRVYETALRMHILPVFGSRSLVAVAGDRESVETFIRYVLPGKGLGASVIRTCSTVINAIVNDAVKSGRLSANQHRLKGIPLPPLSRKAELVFASHAQIDAMAEAMPEGYGPTIYLMRGCGLRLGEALGVRDSDFGIGPNRGTLRLARQLAPDGQSYMPLKHRKADDYRDIPAPSYVIAHYDIAGDMAPVSHRVYRDWFNRARDGAGLPKTFTPHALRHTFASVALAGGVPITDVSRWLGHRNIQVTFGIYGHLVPVSWERARAVLDEEWENDK